MDKCKEQTKKKGQTQGAEWIIRGMDGFTISNMRAFKP